MEFPSKKTKAIRRASAQFYMSAEDHVENEVKHERLLTECSRLSSSWASLRLSGNERPDSSDYGLSSPGSSDSSPNINHPRSFSGPLMISVTCSSTVGACESKHLPNSNACVNALMFTGSVSCHPSPNASPVSSRIQCYSPGIGPTAKKRTASNSSGGSGSPLTFSAFRAKKRLYPYFYNGACHDESAGESRESSPDPSGCTRGSKSIKFVDSNSPTCLLDYSNAKWTSTETSFVSTPPSPSTNNQLSSPKHLPLHTNIQITNNLALPQTSLSEPVNQSGNVAGLMCTTLPDINDRNA